MNLQEYKKNLHEYDKKDDGLESEELYEGVDEKV